MLICTKTYYFLIFWETIGHLFNDYNYEIMLFESMQLILYNLNCKNIELKLSFKWWNSLLSNDCLIVFICPIYEKTLNEVRETFKYL